MAEQLITRTGRLNPVQDVTSVTDQAESTKELQELSNKFGELGDVLRQKKVQSDVITAKIAFEMEKQMPGGLEPEAEVAFNNMTAENAANKFITEFTLDNDVRSSLILQNPKGDSPSQMQELYERQVGDGVSKFLTNTGLNDSQIAHVAPLLDKYKNVATNQFTSALTKQIDDTKTAEGNEAIKTAVENQVVFHKELESTGAESNLTELFTVQWHKQLSSNIMKALPYFTKDEVDNLIVDNLSLIASDPDDPQPDILEYLDKPQKGDRTRFSSIKGLGKKIATAQKTARNALIKVEKIRAKQEAAIVKQREDDAEHSGSDWLTQQFEQNTPASKDLNLLQKEMERLFPDMKESVVRAMIGNAEKRLISKSSSLSSQANAASITADIDEGDFATFEDVTADPRYRDLGGKQYEDVFRKFNEWKKGVVSQASTVKTQQRGMFKTALEANVIANLDPADIIKHINPITGQIINLPFEELERINNLTSQYDLQAANVVRNFSDDPTKIDDALVKLRLDMMRGLGMSQTEAEDLGLSTEKKVEKEERLSATGQLPSQLLEEEGQEETPVETIEREDGGGVTTSSEISKGNESYLPTEPDPVKHVKPATLEVKEEIKASIKGLQEREFDPNVDISVGGTTFLSSSDPEQQKVIDDTIATLTDAGQAISKAIQETPEVLQKGIERAFESLENLGKQISEPLGKAMKDLGQGILENVINPVVSSGATPAEGFVPEGSDLGDNTESEPIEDSSNLGAPITAPNANPQEFDTQGDLIETFDPNTTDLPEIQNLSQFTAGGEGAAGPDPRIAQREQRDEFATDTIASDFLDEEIQEAVREDTEASQIISDEGFRSTVYVDTQDTPTVGIGFNLLRPDARQKIEALGLDFDQVASGAQGLTKEQALKLARNDIKTARKDASKFVGAKVFKGLDKKRQDILTNMSFQLGLPTLKKFTEMRKALVAGDFLKAAQEMVNSLWFQQTPNRAGRLIIRMLENN